MYNNSNNSNNNKNNNNNNNKYRKVKKILIQMLNLAMYSASICLEVMHKNSYKFKSVLLSISMWLYTHLTI